MIARVGTRGNPFAVRRAHRAREHRPSRTRDHRPSRTQDHRRSQTHLRLRTRPPTTVFCARRRATRRPSRPARARTIRSLQRTPAAARLPLSRSGRSGGCSGCWGPLEPGAAVPMVAAPRARPRVQRAGPFKPFQGADVHRTRRAAGERASGELSSPRAPNACRGSAVLRLCLAG
jgi:hypothetical protein